LTIEQVQENAKFVEELEAEVFRILEAEASNRPWSAVDKSKLPAACFLWIEDPKKKSTWHLPYKEGAGSINPATGMYATAGQVNLNALRAIAQAVGGSRTGKPMSVPGPVKTKINRLLKQYKIGKFAEQKPEKNMGREIIESMMDGGLTDVRIDKEAHKVHGVAILRSTSPNRTFRDAKGRKYLPKALESVARLVNGAKVYIDHPTDNEMKERRGVRSMRDVLGFLENGRVDDKGTVRGDLEYLSSHAEWFEPIVEQMADKVGNSIHAYGETHLDKSDMMEAVEDIRMLASVDLVTEPGSTSNLYEAQEEIEEEEEEIEEGDQMEYTNLNLKDLREQRPDLVKELAEQVKGELEEAKTIENLNTEVTQLKEDKKKLEEEVDKYKLKEQVADKEQRILSFIEESKLDKKFVSEIFMQSLRSAKEDEEIKKMLEDRKKIVEAGSKGVRGMGDDKKVLESDETKSTEPGEYEKAMRS